MPLAFLSVDKEAGGFESSAAGSKACAPNIGVWSSLTAPTTAGEVKPTMRRMCPGDSSPLLTPYGPRGPAPSRLESGTRTAG